MQERESLQNAERYGGFAAVAGAVLLLGSILGAMGVCVFWQFYPELDAGFRLALCWLTGAFCLGAVVRFKGIGGMRSLNVNVPRLEVLRTLCLILLWVSCILGALCFICLFMVSPAQQMEPDDQVWARGIGIGCAVALAIALPGYRHAGRQLRIISRLPQFTARYPLLPMGPLAEKLRVPFRSLCTTVQDLLSAGYLPGYTYDPERDVLRLEPEQRAHNAEDEENEGTGEEA